jgi:heat-inducible transcriptional repressor
LLQLVEQQPHELLNPVAAAACGGVWIGQEHPHPALSDCAVVQAPYVSASGGEGRVALVGPMRMAYATALAAVEAVAGSLSRLLA